MRSRLSNDLRSNCAFYREEPSTSFQGSVILIRSPLNETWKKQKKVGLNEPITVTWKPRLRTVGTFFVSRRGSQRNARFV